MPGCNGELRDSIINFGTAQKIFFFLKKKEWGEHHDSTVPKDNFDHTGENLPDFELEQGFAVAEVRV